MILSLSHFLSYFCSVFHVLGSIDKSQSGRQKTQDGEDYEHPSNKLYTYSLSIRYYSYILSIIYYYIYISLITATISICR